jgi:hypothetical protein
MIASSSASAESRPNRRTVIKAGLAACALSAWPGSLLASWNVAEGRPRPADRNFTSPVIEGVIDRVRAQIAGKRFCQRLSPAISEIGDLCKMN